MQTETAEKATDQESSLYKARYESINKIVLERLDKSLFDAMPREVIMRLMLDSWANLNPLVKMTLQMTLEMNRPDTTEAFVSMAVEAVNSIAAKMWNSSSGFGTTDKPLPDEFRHLLEDSGPGPEPTV